MGAHSASRDPKKAVVGRHRHVSSPGRKFRGSVETATENVKVVDKFFGAVADCLSTLTRVLSEGMRFGRKVLWFGLTVYAIYTRFKYGIGWPLL